jgi:hypothetical protein
MKIVFHTDNIDRIFYSQIIHSHLGDVAYANLAFWNRFKKVRDSWTIHIHPAQDWDGIDGRSDNTGPLNAMIPHGVTGEGIVKAYVIDVDDKGLTSLQNFSAILHEVDHMYLIATLRGVRGTLRNDDLSGNKKGMQMNVSTQEIHDMQQEGKMYQVRAWINTGTWWKKKWTRYSCIALNLPEFVKNYN